MYLAIVVKANCYMSLYKQLQYSNVFILYLQDIKRNNDEKGTTSCKIALFRSFLECGIKTWEQVLKALKNSGHVDIAENVKLQLLENYSKVMNNVVLSL